MDPTQNKGFISTSHSPISQKITKGARSVKNLTEMFESLSTSKPSQGAKTSIVKDTKGQVKDDHASARREEELKTTIDKAGAVVKAVQSYKIYVSSADQTHVDTAVEEQTFGGLGEGGTKIAIKLDKGRALMFPKEATTGMGMHRKAIDQKQLIRAMPFIHSTWARMVDEEIEVSRVLENAGLLSTKPKKVHVSLDLTGDNVVPAYISPSFDSLLKSEGVYVIDVKVPSSSTWNEKSLFVNNEDRYNVEKWIPILTPLLEDIAKICVKGIQVSNENYDAHNLAIVKSREPNSSVPYVARYFGFDFSSKWYSYKKEEETKDKDVLVNRATKLFFSLFQGIYISEFNRQWSSPSESPQGKQLAEKLIEICEDKLKVMIEVML